MSSYALVTTLVSCCTDFDCLGSHDCGTSKPGIPPSQGLIVSHVRLRHGSPRPWLCRWMHSLDTCPDELRHRFTTGSQPKLAGEFVLTPTFLGPRRTSLSSFGFDWTLASFRNRTATTWRWIRVAKVRITRFARCGVDVRSNACARCKKERGRIWET